MMVTAYTSPRVTVGSADYYSERAKAERAAAEARMAGLGGVCRWDDEYNDNSAKGRFVVTCRAAKREA